MYSQWYAGTFKALKMQRFCDLVKYDDFDWTIRKRKGKIDKFTIFPGLNFQVSL